MADNTEEKKTATEEVADDDLSKAWDEVVEEPKKEIETEKQEVEEEKTPNAESEEKPPVEEKEQQASAESEEEHKEQSKLGRKYKGLEAKYEQLLKTVEDLKNSKPVEKPEIIATYDDLDAALKHRDHEQATQKAEYEANYLKQLSMLKTANDDIHDEVVDEMLKNFNVMYDIKNPYADARVNYAEAKAAVLAKKLSGNKGKPVRATSERPPVQPAASATRSVSKPVVLPKLDKEAQEYVNYLRKTTKMTDEEIAKELA